MHLQLNTKRLIQNTVLTQAQTIFKENLVDVKRGMLDEKSKGSDISVDVLSKEGDTSGKHAKQTPKKKEIDMKGFGMKKKESIKDFLDTIDKQAKRQQQKED